jgi:uncharacterized membrane protein YjdF
MTTTQNILIEVFGIILITFALIVDTKADFLSKLVFKVIPFFMGLILIGIAYNLVK